MDRLTDRCTHGQTDKCTHRQTDRHMYYVHMDRQMYTSTDGQTVEWTDLKFQQCFLNSSQVNHISYIALRTNKLTDGRTDQCNTKGVILFMLIRLEINFESPPKSYSLAYVTKKEKYDLFPFTA